MSGGDDEGAPAPPGPGAPAAATPPLPRSAPPPGAPDDFSRLAGALTQGRKRQHWSHIRRRLLVVVFLLLWFIGWITPVITGIPFLIVALVLMAPDFPFAHRLAARIQRKLPAVRRRIPREWRRTPRKRP